MKELILQQKQLSYEKEDALFCILANFQDQNCNKNSGLEYLDNRSRLMSKMEALQEHPLRLVKFINQFPLFQYSSFNICERIDFAAKTT